MLYEGAILAVIVVWFFCATGARQLISATALPLSIIPTFAAMHWFGFSLSTLTLLAQAVVVGILVDDAIVEVENIVRHKKMGKSVLKATEEAVENRACRHRHHLYAGRRLPADIADGRRIGTVLQAVRLDGRDFRAGVAAGRAPADARHGGLFPEKRQPCRSTRRPDHDEICHRRALVHVAAQDDLGLATVFLLVCLGLATRLSSSFVPAADLGYTTISLELPPGSSISDTLAAAEKTRLAVGSVAGIEHVFSTVGVAQAGGGPQQPQAGEVRKASVMLTLKPRGERPRQREIEKRQAPRWHPFRARASPCSGTGAKMSILLSSDNALALKETAHALENDLRGMGGLSNIKLDRHAAAAGNHHPSRFRARRRTGCDHRRHRRHRAHRNGGRFRPAGGQTQP